MWSLNLPHGFKFRHICWRVNGFNWVVYCHFLLRVTLEPSPFFMGTEVRSTTCLLSLRLAFSCFLFLESCLVHFTLLIHLIKLWSQEIWKNTWVHVLVYLAGENDTVWRWFWLCLSLLLTLQVKWMMYWIIFALFSTVEVFTDMFICWWVQLFCHYTDFISTPKTHGVLLGDKFLFIFSLQASFLLWAEDSLFCVAALPLHERLQCAIQEVCSSYTFLKRKGEILSSACPPVNFLSNSFKDLSENICSSARVVM